ncbi:hypothetical protein ACTWPT_27575 [Nonomuraea sp. 3N208]
MNSYSGVESASRPARHRPDDVRLDLSRSVRIHPGTRDGGITV